MLQKAMLKWLLLRQKCTSEIPLRITGWMKSGSCCSTQPTCPLDKFLMKVHFKDHHFWSTPYAPITYITTRWMTHHLHQLHHIRRETAEKAHFLSSWTLPRSKEFQLAWIKVCLFNYINICPCLTSINNWWTKCNLQIKKTPGWYMLGKHNMKSITLCLVFFFTPPLLSSHFLLVTRDGYLC